MKRTKPRRVLMTADTVGGVWTYALELASGLAREGIEVALATMGRPLTEAQRHELNCCAGIRLFESSYKLEWMEDPWSDVVEAGDWLLDLENRLHPDLIHLNGFSHGSLPWRAPRVVVGHSCVLSWWRAVHNTDAPSEWDKYRQSTCAGLQAADVVVAPSRTMLALLAGHYGPFGASKVIYNARNLPPCPDRAKEPFILTAGRVWDSAKNIRLLTEIAPGLSWPLYVAGELDQHITSAPTRVRLLGRLSAAKLLPWFNRASIYALPAKYEPFGLSVLEAALAGCALVLGDIPSLREIWGSAAWFAPLEDPCAFQDALNQLSADSELRLEYGARARRVAAQYTPERMLKGYLDAYTEASAVASGRQSSRSQVLKIDAVGQKTADTATELAA